MIDYLRELNFVSVALRLLLSAVIGFSLGMERGRKRRPARMPHLYAGVHGRHADAAAEPV